MNTPQDIANLILEYLYEPYFRTDFLEGVGVNRKTAERFSDQFVQWDLSSLNNIQVEYMHAANDIEVYHGIMINKPIRKKMTFQALDNKTLHFGFGFMTRHAYHRLLKSRKTAYQYTWQDWKKDESYILFDNYFCSFTENHWGKEVDYIIGDINKIQVEITENEFIWTYSNGKLQHHKSFNRRDLEHKRNRKKNLYIIQL
eukprot:UN24419